MAERTVIWSGRQTDRTEAVAIQIFSDGSATCTCNAFARSLGPSIRCQHIQRAFRERPGLLRQMTSVPLDPDLSPAPSETIPAQKIVWAGEVGAGREAQTVTLYLDGTLTCTCRPGATYLPEEGGRPCQHIDAALRRATKENNEKMIRPIERRIGGARIGRERAEESKRTVAEGQARMKQTFAADFATPDPLVDAAWNLTMSNDGRLVSREEVTPGDIALRDRVRSIPARTNLLREIVENRIQTLLNQSGRTDMIRTVQQADIDKTLLALGGRTKLFELGQNEIETSIGRLAWGDVLADQDPPRRIDPVDSPVVKRTAEERRQERLTRHRRVIETTLEIAFGIVAQMIHVDRAIIALGGYEAVLALSEIELARAVSSLSADTILGDEYEPPAHPYDGIALEPGALTRLVGRQRSDVARAVDGRE